MAAKSPSTPSRAKVVECQHASEREVIAANAERDSIKYKLVEYMQDKVGGEFDGHISGLTDWGMYVEIEPTKVEGMIEGDSSVRNREYSDGISSAASACETVCSSKQMSRV